MRPILKFASIVLCWTVACPTLRSAETWHAGVARTVITPREPMWMSGYAARDHGAEGQLHDLWVKALVLQDPAGETAVLVTMDLVGIDRDTSVQVCQRLQAAHQLNRANIGLSTSHTHSGPVVGLNLAPMYFLNDSQERQVRDYTSELMESIVQTVGLAMDRLRPVTLQFGEGLTTFAVNRRNNREADVPTLRAAGKLRGPFDHSVAVLVVRSLDGPLVAVVFGYACHATTLDGYFWSGDWPGYAQIEIEKRHADAMALFWAGCGADQNPVPRRSIASAVEYGDRMANAVDDVLSQPLPSIEGRLRTAYQEIDLPLDSLPTRDQLASDARSDDRYVANRAKQLLRKLDSTGKISSTYPYPVQMWRLGQDVRFVSLGGEVVVDFAIRLKHELRPGPVWVAAYMNDVMAYIPSERVLTEGGYEGGSAMVYYGLPSKWAPGVERMIIDAVRGLATSLGP